ncbi:MAG: Na(+)-translocating NADH-quinone reductase subunit A [Bacteroidetes bacterium]|nr:Na(+)-translocating NADH-quinone reductase subunit A [Bacteroidota bacterium]
MSKVIKIRKGLNIPLIGEAEKILTTLPRSNVYSIKPADFHGLTPKMLINEGEKVKPGTPLFKDKYNEDVIFTSPVSGTFSGLIRGDKRKILEVQIKPEETDDYVDFGARDPLSLDRAEVVSKILQSGLWPVIRQRPYSVIAKTSDNPKSIFVAAFSSVPLGPDLDFIVNGQEATFQTGLNALSKLTNGKVHLSLHNENSISKAYTDAKNVEIHYFKGPHPAGNVGIQIHHIDPINKGDVVWYLDVQGVIMIGRLFEKGIYDARKIVALVGSEASNQRYFKLINGACVKSVIENNLKPNDSNDIRIISGDVLSGSIVSNDGFIGFYDQMISVIPEGNKPEFVGWITPQLNKFSISRTFFSFLTPWKKYRIDTNIRSGERPFVVTGQYEKVLPMDIYPVQLLKAILAGDIELMEKLGIYEVAPEDLALCEFVCSSKTEVQHIIREGLDLIKKEFE